MIGELVIVSLCTIFVQAVSNEYNNKRQAIIDAENKYATGGHSFLTAKESQANKILLSLKNQSISDGIINPDSYAPGMHFFHAKHLIDSSDIFKIIKAIPKGSVLHLHNVAAVSSEWIIKNLTYRPEAKLCESNGNFFFTTRISHHCPKESVKSIQQLRKENGTEESFDIWLESLINLKLRNPDLMRRSINHVWDEFEQMFSALKEMVSYKPFFEDFHKQLLKEFYEDNVLYIELRMSLSRLYDENDRTYDEFEVAKIIGKLVESFKQENSDFMGAKIIYSKHRGMDNKAAQDQLNTFANLNKDFPNLVIGFDLVGQEDINQPLSVFMDELQTSQKSTAYFFHAGETNGYGSAADLNLVDAMILNTRRIGHGYSLYKHSVLWRAIKSKGIALEVCPLSNQVLRLVDDLRNHPAVFYVSENIPIVISCDDPGFWDSKGISYDFYYAFMSIASSSAGIGFLKQIVWDSVRYSSLTTQERQQFSQTLQARWDSFMDELIAGKLIANDCV
ncbi:LOW QUALITY PROTEIN: adenosine deaminase 2-like [Malaya genurostris]|uniref:LOW QUALITY PROTEIN: adenosine deaminase 2-like n=1 Tax=Malaya genurostris TaxID=325434 RepID=UPI0026F401BC|nr:LOW QUALITY PROTEIN: adenosine deaminase 2-like [Malaya genurostris]